MKSQLKVIKAGTLVRFFTIVPSGSQWERGTSTIWPMIEGLEIGGYHGIPKKNAEESDKTYWNDGTMMIVDPDSPLDFAIVGLFSDFVIMTQLITV